MEQINKKILERAIAVVNRPWTYRTDETPVLAAAELVERVKEIYMMGFEDGCRQREGDSVISKITGDGGH